MAYAPALPPLFSQQSASPSTNSFNRFLQQIPSTDSFNKFLVFLFPCLILGLPCFTSLLKEKHFNNFTSHPQHHTHTQNKMSEHLTTQQDRFSMFLLAVHAYNISGKPPRPSISEKTDRSDDQAVCAYLTKHVVFGAPPLSVTLTADDIHRLKAKYGITLVTRARVLHPSRDTTCDRFQQENAAAHLPPL
jgi:predicted lactoylglutathione lyase